MISSLHMSQPAKSSDVPKLSFRDPVPEVREAARYLDAAVSALQRGHAAIAESLIRLADLQAVREWTESIWGCHSLYVPLRFKDQRSNFQRAERVKARMPSSTLKAAIHERDGFHCRFCGIPVIRKEIRNHLRSIFPNVLPWGSANKTQHAAFQAMWAQYDHILPHSRGGANDLANLVLTCAPCNFGRMDATVEEAGLADPRSRSPISSDWDGLERVVR